MMEITEYSLFASFLDIILRFQFFFMAITQEKRSPKQDNGKG